MTNNNYSHIAVVLDRSGSMDLIQQSAEDSLNEFINGQKEVPGHATFSLTKFDNVVELAPTTNLQSVEKILLQPRGMTALYDAIGFTIRSLGSELAAKDESERPGRVLVVIVTDGRENASKEYHRNDIQKMIRHQTDVYNWNFVFLAANQDAVLTAQGLGISRDSSLTFAATDHGIATASGSLGAYSTQYRSTGASSFTDKDRADAAE